MKIKQLLGAAGERRARMFLQQRGFDFIAANARTRLGEVDLIMRDGPELVFVEVKTRQGSGAGLPEAAITPLKLRRVCRVAESWRLTNGHVGPWRVDVVAIDPRGTRHYPNLTMVY